MNKLPIALGSLTAAVIGLVVALAVAGVFDSDSSAGPGDGEQADSAALCIEGAEDCEDTIVVPGDGDEDVTDTPPPDDGDPILAILYNDGVVDEGESPAIDAAFAELEAMEPLLSGIVTVILVEATDWPNACLGIETPGVACAQVITPGYIVTLVTGDAGWLFHTDANGHAVFAGPVGIED